MLLQPFTVTSPHQGPVWKDDMTVLPCSTFFVCSVKSHSAQIAMNTSSVLQYLLMKLMSGTADMAAYDIVIIYSGTGKCSLCAQSHRDSIHLRHQLGSADEC